MIKRLEFVETNREDLRDFPTVARRDVAYALQIAQEGGKHSKAKPLKGFGGAGILEVVESHDGDPYRAVYTVRFEEAVYVLDCFKKKSRSGVATPGFDIELIRRSLKEAERRHDERNEKR